MRPLRRADNLTTFNRNDYQEYFLEGKCGRCVGLTILPPLCADCLEIWDPLPPGTLRAFPGLYRDFVTLYLYVQFNLLKTKRNLLYPYRAVNTVYHGYKKQSVYDVYRNGRYLF
jgi:hypothetical protein